jgi:hypothetical protein
MKRDLQQGRDNARREVEDSPLSRDSQTSESQTQVRY